MPPRGLEHRKRCAWGPLSKVHQCLASEGHKKTKGVEWSTGQFAQHR